MTSKECVLTWVSAEGRLLGLGKPANGYSGFPPYVNDPEAEHIVARGPIPRGEYLIARPRFSKRTGPVALDLQPIGHDAKGRTAFQIHGDRADAPGYASRGCIVLPRNIREEIGTLTRLYPSVVLRVV